MVVVHSLVVDIDLEVVEVDQMPAELLHHLAHQLHTGVVGMLFFYLTCGGLN